jgi:5-formyltetrahydrofolate cyclo-ligase
MRSIRDAIDQETRIIHSDQITAKLLESMEVRTAERLFIYVSFRSEVQTHSLIDELLKLNKEIFVPFIDSTNQMQAVRFSGWDGMHPDAFGVLVPRKPVIEKREIHTAIVPGLAFTTKGVRIGYGKGHYDRFFAGRPIKTRIGIAFDCQILEAIPTNRYDYPMTGVFTESQEFIDNA